MVVLGRGASRGGLFYLCLPLDDVLGSMYGCWEDFGFATSVLPIPPPSSLYPQSQKNNNNSKTILSGPASSFTHVYNS